MTKTSFQAAAVALSLLMSLSVITAINGLATSQYVKADDRAMATFGVEHVAIQHVTIVGHRAAA